MEALGKDPVLATPRQPSLSQGDKAFANKHEACSWDLIYPKEGHKPPASAKLQSTYLMQFLHEVELQTPEPEVDGKAPQNPPAK